MKTLEGLERIIIFWRTLAIGFFIFFIVAGIVVIAFQNQIVELKQIIQQEKVPENCDVVIRSYLLKDGTHTTYYFPCNNSYTIDKPFRCGDTFFGDYDSYKTEKEITNCEVLE